MPDIITRNVISREFKAKNFLRNESITSRKKLVKLINFWKYLLTYKCHAKKGESIYIGIVTIDTDYLAICIAAAELSLKIIINDSSRKYRNSEYMDPKTKLLSPINIHLYDIPNDEISLQGSEKIKFFIKWSERSYNIDNLDKKIDRKLYRISSKIFPEPKDILMKCTSSGTTDTPKIIEHTHEFIYKMSTRNSNLYKGKCLHVRNLHHGSSLANFLLPSLISENVNEHVFHWFDGDEWVDEFIKNILNYKDSLEFISFPYPWMIEKFITYSKSLEVQWPNLNVLTLTYIQDATRNAVKEGVFKSIISQFGSTETGGPVLQCIVDKNNIDQPSNVFNKIDDFYSISLREDDLIEIGVPSYNRSIITNDKFKNQGEYYIFQGRSDLIRLDGETVDLKVINNLNERFQDAFLVTDSLKNCFYLAFWGEENIQTLKDINQEIQNNFKKLGIKKTAILNKKDFLSGIKIDNELIREYFRNQI